MKLLSDTAKITFSDISTATIALVQHIEELIVIEAPAQIVEQYTQTAKRLNNVLARNEFNHHTDEKFEEFERYINKCKEVR